MKAFGLSVLIVAIALFTLGTAVSASVATIDDGSIAMLHASDQQSTDAENRGDRGRGHGRAAENAAAENTAAESNATEVSAPASTSQALTGSARPGWGCGDKNHDHSGWAGPPGNPDATSPCHKH